MFSPFAEIARKETLKRELCAAVEAAARGALEGTALTPEVVAETLISHAYRLSCGWSERGQGTLKKLADGEIATDEELLLYTANRQLNALAMPPEDD